MSGSRVIDMEPAVPTMPAGRRCTRCKGVLSQYNRGRVCAPCRLATLDARVAQLAREERSAGYVQADDGGRTPEAARRAAARARGRP